MQTIIHRSEERGVGEHGWLHTRFSFSFADWYDPSKMGFGVLRVINDDVISPHSGFGKHPHSNMEIITIVREGAVSHEDSMGNSYVVPAGDIQVVSAGTGVIHAEYNRGDVTLKLFQIWIEPRTKNIKPRYSQKSFGLKQKEDTLELLVSGGGDTNVLQINQDVFISRMAIRKGSTLEYMPKGSARGLYIFVVEGNIQIDADILGPRDAIGFIGGEKIVVRGSQNAEALIFEVPLQ